MIRTLPISMPKDLLKLYAGLPAKDLFYLRARWLVSPISAVEKTVPREGRVYDIGCGIGLLSNIMAMSSGKRDVIGVDLSESKIAAAKKSVGSRVNVRFEKADALSLVLDRPDTVVACDLFHHIQFSEQGSFLERIYHALGENGFLLIQDIDKKPFHKYLFAAGVDFIMNRRSNFYYRESSQMREILEKIGFSVEIERLDKWRPIAAVLFKCRKNKRPKRCV